MAQPIRDYVGGHSQLVLDGRDVGLLRSVEGGEPYGEVVVASGGDKRIGAVRYTDIAIECPLVASAPLVDLIGGTLAQSSPRCDGAVVDLDGDFKEVSRRAFKQALIREVEFPALDAAKKDPTYLTIRLAPESTQLEEGGGEAVKQSGSGAGRGTTGKASLVSNFQLQIEGLDANPVSTIGPLVVRQALTESIVGAGNVTLTSVGLELPDLVVTLRRAKDWEAWAESFIVKGSATERNGTLDYLSADRKTVLASIGLSGLGIHSLVRERSEAGDSRLQRVRASIYCEGLSYAVPVAVPPAAPGSGSGSGFAPSRVDVIESLAARRGSSRSSFVELR